MENQASTAAIETGTNWPGRLDAFCTYAGALLPIGIILGNAGFESVIGLVGLAWIARCIIARDNPLPALVRHPLIMPWLAWYAVILLSLFWNGAGSKGWGHDIVFFRQPLFVMAMLDVARRKPVVKPLLIGLGAAVCLAAVNTLAATVVGSDLLGRPLARYHSKVKEAARMAAISAYAAPFFLHWSLVSRELPGRRRLGLALLAGLAFFLVVFTTIRTAVLAVLVGIVFIFFRYAWKRVSTFWLLAMPLLLTSVVVGYQYAYGKLDLSSIYSRVYIWEVSLEMWQEKPVLGVGVSSYYDKYRDFAAAGRVPAFYAPDGSIKFRADETHAHNLLLMLAAATGVCGVLAFSWLLVSAIRLLLRLDGNTWQGGLAAWPVVLLMIGLFGWNIYYSYYQAVQAFFIILIAVAAQKQP